MIMILDDNFNDTETIYRTAFVQLKSDLVILRLVNNTANT